MSSAIDKNENFDREMRQLHATAVNQLSPQTLARLRAARHGLAKEATPRRGHAWRWVTATAFSAVLAVVVGMQFLPQSQTMPAAQPIASLTTDDNYVSSVVTLEENPDLYLWLASSEAEPMAME